MYLSVEQELRMKFPEIYPLSLLIKFPGELAEYRLLNYFGNFCAENFGSKKSEEILLTVNNLYQSENLFVKNAIENEFLFAISELLGTNELINHLQKIPNKLQLAYVKVLFETLKIKKTDDAENQPINKIKNP